MRLQPLIRRGQPGSAFREGLSERDPPSSYRSTKAGRGKALRPRTAGATYTKARSGDNRRNPVVERCDERPHALPATTGAFRLRPAEAIFKQPI